MTTYPSSPVDSLTASTLALIAGDPIHATDRELIVRAVHAEAVAHKGVIDLNGVRRRLTGPHGLTVYPRCIGAVVYALCARGVIEADGWITNEDTAGRNSGKPLKRYRLTTSAQEAA